MSSEAKSVEFPGAQKDVLGGELYSAKHSGGPRRGVVLSHDVAGFEGARRTAERLAENGITCLLPNLWTREGAAPALPDRDARWIAEASLPDRRAIEDLDCAVRFLGEEKGVDADSVGALGLGSGGTLAFLLGCTSRDVAAVACIGGRALYPDLSPQKPIQPLELLLNLDRPLMVLCGAADKDLPGDHCKLWQQKLDAGGKDFEFVVYPGGSPPWADLLPGHPLARVLAFLKERL
ncbi:MAG: carboxymethylenebutenolidase [Planctomycetota bacterium]|jgi:carboxymethylenebutenolidase